MTKSLPAHDRPRERLFHLGATSLSSVELLAIILGTGSRGEDVLQLSRRILSHFGSLRGLAEANPEQIKEIHGLGEAKIAQIMASIEIGRRIVAFSPDERPVIHTASDAVRFVTDMISLPQEHIRVMLLDTSKRVIAVPTVYIGTVNAAVVRTSEIFREAIIRNAPALILIHNHPSGDPTPSPEDTHLTRQLIEAGNLLDISVLDHIIIGRQEWRSLKEMKLGF